MPEIYVPDVSSRGLDAYARARGQGVEIRTQVENGYAGANRDGADQAIDELANGSTLSAACPIQRRSGIMVHWFGGKDGRAGEEPAQLPEVRLVASTREHLHWDGVSRRRMNHDGKD
jgi:hypothetical protein